jgi:phage terminase small subunit
MAEYRRDSMVNNLKARGLVEPHHMDQVARYLNYREMEHQADAEIREMGLNIWDEKRGSWQANPCIGTKMNAGRQATAIYRALGFEDAAKKARAAEEDDDAL